MSQYESDAYGTITLALTLVFVTLIVSLYSNQKNKYDHNIATKAISAILQQCIEYAPESTKPIILWKKSCK